MPRFSRPEHAVKNDLEKQRGLDRAYTLLLCAKDALEKCGDSYYAAKIEDIVFDYKLRGATARYEYRPMH